MITVTVGPELAGDDTSEHCLCCGLRDFDAFPAIVSPFVAERGLRQPPSLCRLLQCRGCGLRFFDERPTDEEIRRLYADYRGDEYYAQRHRHEFWYTRRTNDRLGCDEKINRARQETLWCFLGRHVDVTAVETVLDYGGDRGQAIPTSLGKARFVFDVPGVPVVEGVTGIHSRAALAGRSFDFVMLCHVLEHASDPRALLDDIRPLCHAKSLFYVEVPWERPRLGGILRGRAGELWLDSLIRMPALLRGIDFLSTVLRTAVGIVPPLGFVKLHEHLNFFEETSLRRLLEACYFDVIACERIDVPHAFGYTTVIGCVTRPRPKGPPHHVAQPPRTGR